MSSGNRCWTMTSRHIRDVAAHGGALIPGVPAGWGGGLRRAGRSPLCLGAGRSPLCLGAGRPGALGAERGWCLGIARPAALCLGRGRRWVAGPAKHGGARLTGWRAFCIPRAMAPPARACAPVCSVATGACVARAHDQLFLSLKARKCPPALSDPTRQKGTNCRKHCWTGARDTGCTCRPK